MHINKMQTAWMTVMYLLPVFLHVQHNWTNAHLIWLDKAWVTPFWRVFKLLDMHPNLQQVSSLEGFNSDTLLQIVLGLHQNQVKSAHPP